MMIWLDLLFSATLIVTSSLSALELSLKANIAYHQAIQKINTYESNPSNGSIRS